MSPEPALPAIAPVSQTERIKSIDVIRGVALLGILLMNIVSFGLPDAYMNPSVSGGDTGPNFGFWFVNQILFEGKMRAIFSMLFGAGVVILTSRAEQRGAGLQIADIYYRRNLWLIAFGLLHAHLIWDGDILYMYGVAALFLYPLRHLSPKALLIIGAALTLSLVPKNYLEGREFLDLRAKAAEADSLVKAGSTLTEEQKNAKNRYEEKMKDWKPGPEQIQKEIKTHQSYLALVAKRTREAPSWLGAWYFRIGFFDAAGMMVFGMALYKLGVFSAACSYRAYWLMLLLGYGIGAPLNAWSGLQYANSNWDPAVKFISGFTTYDIGRFSVAFGHIALTMIVCKAGLLGFLTRRLAAVGQMALTNYLMASTVSTTIFNGYGFGLFGKLQRFELLYVVGGISAFQLIASPIWLAYFRFGPMEWLWRSLTYWKRQPMRLHIDRAESGTAATAGATA